MIWQNRKVIIKNGNFMMSCVGQHDVWDFAKTDSDVAVCGHIGASATIRKIIKIDEERLLILDATGYYVLVGRGCPLCDWRIGSPCESIIASIPLSPSA